MSETQIIIILKKFRDFFACKIVLTANHFNPENFQNLFGQQNCLSRKSSISWKSSKTFSCKLSWPQIIFILQLFKIFLASKIVWDANHHYPENIQRFYRLQICLSRKSFLSWNYSKTFSPAKMSETQIIIILKKFRDFFACKIVLTANHFNPENFQNLFGQQNCLSRKSSSSWKYSRSFPPAKMSSTQITLILKTFKDFFDRNFVLDASHHYPGNIQRLFFLQIVLAANHLHPEIIQNFSRLQNCLRRKSSLSWKYSKILSTAKLS